MPSVNSHNHTQDTPSATWTVNHNLNTLFPVVDCWIDYEGVINKILPLEVTVVDSMNVVITFSEDRSGGAAIR